MSKNQKEDLYSGMGENYNRIYCKLVSRKQYEDKLEKIPHEDYLDMVVVYYMKLMISKNDYLTICIQHKNLQTWGIDEEALKALAWKNTIRDNSPLIKKLTDVIKELGGPEEDEQDIYVLTNEEMDQGAVVLLYPQLLQLVSERMGGDIYVLPSSIHEVILVRKNDKEDQSAFLRDTVRSINKTEVREEEVLSENIYLYERSAGVLIIDNS